jgi:putative hemolysin
MIIYLISVIILLFFSFVFSGSETALFAFSKTMRAKIREEYQYPLPQAQVTLHHLNIVETLLNKPSSLLATILFSNLVVNTTASSLFTLFAITFARNYHLPRDLHVSIGALVMTILLVSFGEITPKVLAMRNPQKFAFRTSGFIHFLTRIFSFITIPLRKLGDWFLSRLSRYVSRTPFPSENDLKTIIELSRTQGLIQREEQDFLFSLVELSHRRVSEVMTPRIKMVCLEKDVKISDALKLIIKETLPLISRIPVYKNNIDNIVGILYLKDLITKGRKRIFFRETVEKIARPPYFIPENKSLSELLEDLRKKDSHIAIVVDEFGQTAGLVTLEDILEALLGEIRDEYDTVEEMPFERIDDNTYLVSGDIDLKALDRLFPDFSSDIPVPAGYRLSGFIHHHWGRIPKHGEILEYKNFRIEIKEITKKRFEKILITKVESAYKSKP